MSGISGIFAKLEKNHIHTGLRACFFIYKHISYYLQIYERSEIEYNGQIRKKQRKYKQELFVYE